MMWWLSEAGCWIRVSTLPRLTAARVIVARRETFRRHRPN
jgi:hypothetical protein